MKRRGDWLKIILVLAVAFLVAALLHGLINQQWFAGDALKVAFLAVALGFVILTWNEQGLFYALGSAVILSAMAAVVYGGNYLLTFVFALLYFALFAGLMYLGDWASRRILVLRAVVSFAAGIIAGVIIAFLLPNVLPSKWRLAQFMLDLQGNGAPGNWKDLVYAIETTGGAAIALLVARLIGGTKKDRD